MNSPLSLDTYGSHAYLDALQQPVMLTDDTLTVRYANRAANDLFARLQGQVRTRLPDFSVERMVGQPIALFHADGERVRRRVSELRAPQDFDIKLGDAELRCRVAPVYDDGGARVGTLVEWQERHAEQTAQLLRDLGAMAASHNAGDIDAVIDTARYRDEFAQVAQAVNTMVGGHIAVKRAAMACVAEIARGNFDAPLERFPGKKAFINDTIEALRANLRGLIDAMNHMSTEHDAGDIDVFIEADRFGGAFGTMAEGINRMVQGHIAVKRKAMACVDAFAHGDFDAELEPFPGKKAFINTTLDTLRRHLKGLIAELQRLVAASASGQLSERAQVGELEGDFARLVGGINRMLDEILLPIAEGNRILRQIRGGNLREKVEIECRGDHEKMKNAVNGVHAWLEELIGFVTHVANGDLAVDMARASDDDQIHEWLMLLKTNIGNIARDAAALSQGIVDGRLDLQVDASAYAGEYRRIIEAFGRAFDGLNATFYQVVDAVDQVSQAAQQLSAASQDMASSSEEQSSAVEEVTSSLEETDSQVKANTDNATAANALVVETTKVAERGQDKMKSMSDAMNAIDSSSHNIAKIIKVIDEIAFQTNILALNAAVEAARAGQHGRGFAVVAQEVRNLAGRSAKAARETAELIDDSSKRVAQGVSIAAETGGALEAIVGNVLKVRDLVAEIATASTEQSRGVSQINTAMGQVATAAQEGSQQAEELAASSAQLSSVARQLHDEVARFQLRARAVETLNVPGLGELSAEQLRQLKALLLSPQAARGQAAPRPAKRPARSPAPTLDADERGFNGF